MATAAADGSNRGVSIGRILSRAFGTLRTNPVTTLGIGFLLSALPSLLHLYFIDNLQDVMLGRFVGSGGFLADIVVGLFMSFAPLIVWAVAQGALVPPTIAFAEGGKAGLGESLSAALRVALPLFLFALMGFIAIVFGLLLLVVPGIMLYVMWSAAVPALVEERLGPIKAFGRSRELTRGARWTIFGLLLVLVILYWLFAALTGLFSILSGSTVEPGVNVWSAMSPADIAVTLMSWTITSAVGGVIHASLYVELREWKDGPRTESLARIFA